jgi:hypothetical protein
MGLILGPKIANGKCGKTTDAGTMDRGSTVYKNISVWVITLKPYKNSDMIRSNRIIFRELTYILVKSLMKSIKFHICR